MCSIYYMVSIMYNPTSLYIFYIRGVLHIHSITASTIFSNTPSPLTSTWYQSIIFKRCSIGTFLFFSWILSQPNHPLFLQQTCQLQHFLFSLLILHICNLRQVFQWLLHLDFFCVYTYSFSWMQLSSNNGNNTFLCTDCFGTAWTPLYSVNYS